MNLALNPQRTNSRKLSKPLSRQNVSQYAIDEINAYVAVRDGMLEEAELNPTEANLERLVLANNFVANCLRPTRQPYITQYLPDADAARELKQCQAVDSRIAKLRTTLVRAA